MSHDLNEAKQKLLNKLGSNYSIYIQLLGKWFRGMITKEEFDKNARQLIEQNFVLEHNKFWLAFFHHCANSASSSIQTHNFQINNAIGQHFKQRCTNSSYGLDQSGQSPDSTSAQKPPNIPNYGSKVRCLPNKVITHMKIFVIAWEMGLDSANDHVSLYINLALQHFLKNIITELICTKTAYRLRENKFKYAIGVKPMNPYLNNSLKVFSSNLEYDPYQIESNKMNSSLVDTYAYNDSLFPSRLYEAQALYEFACSTTSVKPVDSRPLKRLKLSELFISETEEMNDCCDTRINGISSEDANMTQTEQNESIINGYTKSLCSEEAELKSVERDEKPTARERRLSLYHLLIAFLSNRTIIPSQSLYSSNLERIFTKLSC